MARNNRDLTLTESLKILREVRTDEVVITAMGAAREWMTLGTHPLDFVFVPSSMGQATSLGLGMALAQPNRGIVVCNGDGSTLMNLGSLITITAHAPKNLTLITLDNGVYEVTGAQETVASRHRRANRGDIDLGAIARACGFESVYAFDDSESWASEVRHVVDEPGPTFVLLKVPPVPGAVGPKSPGPAPERARQFMQAIASN